MRARLLQVWRHLPMLLGLVLLFVPLALWLAAQVPAWRAPLRALDGPGLIGMPATPPPKDGLAAVWTGEWQRYAQGWVDDELPLRNPVVRATNQLYYSAFRSSYMLKGTLVVGRQGQLMEREYITDYCNHLHERFDDARFDRWAAQIARLRDRVQARGQAFVYLITPAKPAAVPQYIPGRMPCPAADEARPRYRAALAALRRAGIAYIDGSAMVHALMQREPIPDFFTRGGTHWTNRAATPVTATLLETIRYADGGRPAPLHTVITPGGAPNAVDTDLLDLANLWRRGAPYTTPSVAVTPAPASDKPRSLALVGGSFANQIMELLGATKQYRRMDYFYYLDMAHLTYPGRIHQPTDAPDVYDALFTADVVVVEENETKMPSPHVANLEAVLAAGPRR